MQSTANIFWYQGKFAVHCIFPKNYHAFIISLFQTNIRILSKQQAMAKKTIIQTMPNKKGTGIVSDIHFIPKL